MIIGRYKIDYKKETEVFERYDEPRTHTDICAIELRPTVAAALRKAHAAMLALEGLTPGGSEFVGDVTACVTHIRRRYDRDHQMIVKFKLDRDELQRQLETAQVREVDSNLIGLKNHPEDYCHRCGGRNIGWYADSDLWNRFDPPESIICPICFVIEAESKGVVTPAWRISPEDTSDEKERLFVRLHEGLETIANLRDQIQEAERCGYNMGMEDAGIIATGTGHDPIAEAEQRGYLRGMEDAAGICDSGEYLGSDWGDARLACAADIRTRASIK